ncbi:helix-turn-helix domain-containing protein [Niabella hirudinis]|uniref:helix-turn-helix domain-containing protein n=1 Tax=Niabella hirudinis TaxID=1285929 RepID=UPI003EB916DD
MIHYLENDTVVARNLKRFLNGIPLSLRDFSGILVEVSQATLSRIINGSSTFKYDKLKTIAEALGVSVVEIQTPSCQIPERDVLVRNLKRFIKKHNPDTNISLILNQDHSAHFVDLYIHLGRLDSFQSISVIKQNIKDEFGVSLVSSNITNTLSRRKKNIESRAGERTNTLEYRRRR